MATKKKVRDRLKISADIYNVFNKKLSKKQENALLKPLFDEMAAFEKHLNQSNERIRKKLAKLPQVCSEYEIFHNRGCGKCKACLEDSGERYYPNQPKFLK